VDEFREDTERDGGFRGDQRLVSWRGRRRGQAAATSSHGWKRCRSEAEGFRSKGGFVQQERPRGNSQDLDKRSSLCRFLVDFFFVGANQAGRQEPTSERRAISLRGVEF
jgi:hypothetical protein